jgi:hypothetical protein
MLLQDGVDPHPALAAGLGLTWVQLFLQAWVDQGPAIAAALG